MVTSVRMSRCAYHILFSQIQTIWDDVSCALSRPFGRRPSVYLLVHKRLTKANTVQIGLSHNRNTYKIHITPNFNPLFNGIYSEIKPIAYPYMCSSDWPLHWCTTLSMCICIVSCIHLDFLIMMFRLYSISLNYPMQLLSGVKVTWIGPELLGLANNKLKRHASSIDCSKQGLF